MQESHHSSLAIHRTWPESLRINSSRPLMPPERARSSLQMLAPHATAARTAGCVCRIPRGIAALCALIGHVLATCSDALNSFTGSKPKGSLVAEKLQMVAIKEPPPPSVSIYDSVTLSIPATRFAPSSWWGRRFSFSFSRCLTKPGGGGVNPALSTASFHLSLVPFSRTSCVGEDFCVF
jgi:hypothetical protein